MKASGPIRMREVGRFRIRPPDQTEQYRQELIRVLKAMGPCSTFSAGDLSELRKNLSAGSPYVESPIDSLKLLGFADDSLRPMPSISQLWKDSSPVPPAKDVGGVRIPAIRIRGDAKRMVSLENVPTQVTEKAKGRITNLRRDDGYAFIRPEDRAPDVFVHRSKFLIPSEWNEIEMGTTVTFEYEFALPTNRARPARNVRTQRENC